MKSNAIDPKDIKSIFSERIQFLRKSNLSEDEFMNHFLEILWLKNRIEDLFPKAEGILPGSDSLKKAVDELASH